MFCLCDSIVSSNSDWMELVDIGRLELAEIGTLKNWRIAKLNDVEGRAKISASSCVLI